MVHKKTDGSVNSRNTNTPIGNEAAKLQNTLWPGIPIRS